MNLFQWIRNLGRTRPQDPFRAAQTFFPQRYVPSDLRLTPDDQLSVSTVFGCVRVIAEAVASSPWKVYVRDAMGNRSELPDDPVAYILNTRPNPDVPAQSFKEALLVQALVYGNAFAEIVRDQAGRVVELWLLPSDRVVVMRDPQSKLYYEYNNPQGGPTVQLQPSQVFHYRSLASVDGLLGDSIVGRASKTIAVQFAAERYALNFYGNNARIGGVLKVPRPLQPGEEKDLQESWEAGRAGVGNSFKTAVLPPGVEWQAITANPDEAALVDTQKVGVEAILRYFGVPGFLVGSAAASQGYGRNLAEMGLAFVRNTLKPWTNRLEQEANYKLFPQRAPWKFSQIDLTWLTLGSAIEVAQTQDIYLKNGTLSVNEVRDQLGLNSIGDDGDERVSLAEQAEPPEPAAAQAPEMDTEDTEDTGGTDQPPGTQEGTDGVLALHRMVLSKHQARLRARKTDLEKTLKNGVLQEKLMAAVEQSRLLAERDLNHAGLNCPPGWMSALLAAENGGDPGDLARALNEVRS